MAQSGHMKHAYKRRAKHRAKVERREELERRDKREDKYINDDDHVPEINVSRGTNVVSQK